MFHPSSCSSTSRAHVHNWKNDLSPAIRENRGPLNAWGIRVFHSVAEMELLGPIFGTSSVEFRGLLSKKYLGSCAETPTAPHPWRAHRLATCSRPSPLQRPTRPRGTPPGGGGGDSSRSIGLSCGVGNPFYFLFGLFSMSGSTFDRAALYRGGATQAETSLVDAFICGVRRWSGPGSGTCRSRGKIIISERKN